jgi:hypothetical protein
MKRNFIKSAPPDVIEIQPESNHRMSDLTEEEIQRMYGKGYKLLKRSGYTTGESHAPLKVLIRNPREGLKDNDGVGRKVLGEVFSKKEKPSEDWLQIMVDDVRKLVQNIREEVRNRDGCVEISELFDILKGTLRFKNRLLFSRALSHVSIDDVKRNDEGSHLILVSPTQLSRTTLCACEDIFPSQRHWSIHVFQALDQHLTYSETLRRFGDPFPHCVSCLICIDNTFANLLPLLQHCRQIADTQHEMFGRLLITTFLLPNQQIEKGVDTLLLGALESGDRQFPWRGLCGGAKDPFNDIPFPDGPPTPIVVDSVDSDDDNPLEIIDIDNQITGEINLEE